MLQGQGAGRKAQFGGDCPYPGAGRRAIAAASFPEVMRYAIMRVEAGLPTG